MYLWVSPYELVELGIFFIYVLAKIANMKRKTLKIQKECGLYWGQVRHLLIQLTLQMHKFKWSEVDSMWVPKNRRSTEALNEHISFCIPLMMWKPFDNALKITFAGVPVKYVAMNKE